MLITYSCEIRCPECDEVYYERRFKPYKYQISKKCPDCKKPTVIESGGRGDKKCGSCKYFSTHHPEANDAWGKCGLGYFSDDMDDEDHEQMDLVYLEDLCNDYEPSE